MRDVAPVQLKLPSGRETLFSVKPKQRLGSVHFTVLAGPANWFQARSCCCVMEQANVMMKPGWSWWWLSQGLQPHLFVWQATGVCVRARVFLLWHKGYGLSYRGDRWYVYSRMFAFCWIFNYRVCVCVTACEYVCVRERPSVSLPCHLCFKDCVEDLQAFINHIEFAHFLPRCPTLSPG